MRQVFDGQTGFFCKAVRRQIVGVAARRRLPDFQKTFFDAALQVGVDEAERDAEVGSELALGLGAVALDRLQEPEHDRSVIWFVLARRLRHEEALPSALEVHCSWRERQARCSYGEHC